MSDVVSEVAELAANGVTFEQYEGFDQDDKGVATMGPDKVAWIRDPDGNTIGPLAEGLAPRKTVGCGAAMAPH